MKIRQASKIVHEVTGWKARRRLRRSRQQVSVAMARMCQYVVRGLRMEVT